MVGSQGYQFYPHHSIYVAYSLFHQVCIPSIYCCNKCYIHYSYYYDIILFTHLILAPSLLSSTYPTITCPRNFYFILYYPLLQQMLHSCDNSIFSFSSCSVVDMHWAFILTNCYKTFFQLTTQYSHSLHLYKPSSQHSHSSLSLNSRIPLSMLHSLTSPSSLNSHAPSFFLVKLPLFYFYKF